MDRGELVPDSIVIGMVDEVLATIGKKSVILDGFPRTVAQAEALGKILAQRKMEIGKAIFLEVPREDLLARLTGRRVCKACGAVYHVVAKPSKEAGICDSCGGEVIQRNDDKEEVIATRLKAYEDNTFPLKAYYKELKRYIEVQGNRESEAVFEAIKTAMK
jgi:adenylate kinase